MRAAVTRRAMLGGAAALLLFTAYPHAEAMARMSPELAARLTPEQLAAYQAHLAARASFERQLEMYWAMIEERKDHRRKKRAANLAMTTADYVAEQPPKYAGPPLPPDVQKVIESLIVPSTEPEKTMANVADFVSAARTQYGFAPTITTERDFKRRYAMESLHLGLTKLQVVRVYALETGGDGTFDMQAGFHPVTRQGKPISSALGYAQLLGANSVSELVKYGGYFAERLEAAAATPGIPPQHAQTWANKAQIVRRMWAASKTVPNEWNQHEKFAQTPLGQGIHALNLDADVGPWLQALKLRGIVDYAAKEANRTSLTGGQLELMNLAGPRNGLEMMEPAGSQMPTANFFQNRGYYRNTIVREKNGAELLRALDDRMDISIKRPGAVEFLAVFDEVMAGQPQQAARSALRGPVSDQPANSQDQVQR
jgi:hypothetical protein